jgi:elongation factor 1-gamma
LEAAKVEKVVLKE